MTGNRYRPDVAYVRVEHRPFSLGTTYYQECEADVFEPGTLTITTIETGAIVDVLKPGTWRSATAYSAGDWPLYWFDGPEAEIVSVCAWCPDKEERTREAEARGKQVSHTMCARCSERMAIEAGYVKAEKVGR